MNFLRTYVQTFKYFLVVTAPLNFLQLPLTNILHWFGFIWNSKCCSKNLILIKKNFCHKFRHKTVRFIVQSRVSSSGTRNAVYQIGTQLSLIHVSQCIRNSFLIPNSFRVVIRMGKEYLSIFKSLKAKEKARPLSVVNFKDISINLLCALFR